MPGLNELENVTIAGRIWGAYVEEPQFRIDGLPDRLVGLTELLKYILDNLGGAIAVFTTLQENFAGTTYDIPLAVNNGKLPADEDKVEVFTNGILDYPVLDYSIVRNGPGVSDQILFTDERLPQALLVRFIA
ncbi:MAG: hypothetical protein R2824_15870 [Saprospiraceae bacterium]